MKTELSDSNILLFPHCYLTEGALHKALANFEKLRICLPWYMEAPEALSKIPGDSRVTILYPPESLKPSKDFLPLLSEYRLWMKENMGKAPSLSAPDPQKKEASWEIRKIIRPKEGNDSETEKDRVIRWHLILHLAAELEEENAEVEASLKHLKITGSPLKEAMGDEDLAKGILDDLPLTSPASSGKITQRLNHWVKAWFGLFSSHVQPDADLLTLDRDIFQFVLDLFEGPISETKNGPESANPSSGKTRPREPVRLPGLSHRPDLKGKEILEELAGKSIHLLEDL